MMSSTLTIKGQTTVPAVIRKALNLHAGDMIEYVINKDGTVTMILSTVEVSELYGLLPKSKKQISIEEMNKVINKRRGKSDRPGY